MDMQQIMEQARLMQQQLEDAQNNMGEIELTATAGGGMVTVTGTADMKITSIKIDPEAVDPDDVEMLQDLIIAAVGEAMKQVDAESEKLFGGLGGF